jgi:hypothetical protein
MMRFAVDRKFGAAKEKTSTTAIRAMKVRAFRSRSTSEASLPLGAEARDGADMSVELPDGA